MYYCHKCKKKHGNSQIGSEHALAGRFINQIEHAGMIITEAISLNQYNDNVEYIQSLWIRRDYKTRYLEGHIERYYL